MAQAVRARRRAHRPLRDREVRAVRSSSRLNRASAGSRTVTRRKSRLARVAVAPLLALASALTAQCGGSLSSSPTRSPAEFSQPSCAALWQQGFELRGVVGGREAHAYFDMAPVQEAPPHRVSGIVLFPQDRDGTPLADAAIGLAGPRSSDGCAAELTQGDGDAVWTLRIVDRDTANGQRRLRDDRTEDAAFTIVPETLCDGAGEWRTFSSPDWPITFEYPAAWEVSADHDDVTVECPSVTRLAHGGSWLTFEQGRFEPAGRTDPYWFSRSADGEWRVNAGACASCPRARRSERNGMTFLQGAAGEHRLYRPGVGYLGPGAGITRYLFIAGDRWVSLDVAGSNGHHDEIGDDGGVVLVDGDTVGDRLVRSIRRR